MSVRLDRVHDANGAPPRRPGSRRSAAAPSCGAGAASPSVLWLCCGCGAIPRRHGATAHTPTASSQHGACDIETQRHRDAAKAPSTEPTKEPKPVLKRQRR
eukprot:COSAG01_NODE_7647_length_3115_cov_1.557692_7_plen_101_part_00